MKFTQVPLEVLMEAFSGRCLWCGGEVRIAGHLLREDVPPEQTATREHVLPKSRGGDDGVDNIALACLRCNNARGNSPRPGQHQDPARLRLLSEGHRWAWDQLDAMPKAPAPWRSKVRLHLLYGPPPPAEGFNGLGRFEDLLRRSAR